MALNLPPLEAQIVALLIRGFACPEAARILRISKSAMNRHMERIHVSMDVHRRADLVRVAARLYPPLVNLPARPAPA